VGESGRPEGGGKAGDRVLRELSVISRKLVRRRKQDVLGRWGFAIVGHRERGSMREHILEDAG